MPSIKRLLLATVTLGALATATTAEANVVYTFDGTATGTLYRDVKVVVELYTEVGESASARGAGSGPVFEYRLGGEDLISVNIFDGTRLIEGFNNQYLRGTFDLALNVNSAGLVTSSAFEYLGENISFSITGTNAMASGAIAQSNAPCTLASANCTLEGSWTLTAVPEPMSLALFSVGLLGMAAVSRKRRG